MISMIDGLFEILMLLCFATAWPFSIHRSIVSKSTKGKSVGFLFILVIGYIMGVINKFVSDDINYVLYFYFLDMALVSIDIALYYRNKSIEKKAESLVKNS